MRLVCESLIFFCFASNSHTWHFLVRVRAQWKIDTLQLWRQGKDAELQEEELHLGPASCPLPFHGSFAWSAGWIIQSIPWELMVDHKNYGQSYRLD